MDTKPGNLFNDESRDQETPPTDKNGPALDPLAERIQRVRAELTHFSGSEQFYHLPALCKETLILTDGAHYVCRNCGGGPAGTAYWLMDVIASYQGEPAFKRNDFQVWTLTIKSENGTRSAQITCTDGNEKVLVSQDIAYTDFLLDEGITLYAIRDRYPDHVRPWTAQGRLTVLLPTEY